MSGCVCHVDFCAKLLGGAGPTLSRKGLGCSRQSTGKRVVLQKLMRRKQEHKIFNMPHMPAE
jgi:hypothetical protein